jgi:NADPH-dependent glutamate synthase beta subunit-like oxidoreductase/NAD-dependent dihydropyrimidine dehydrogenase PreA subunit
MGYGVTVFEAASELGGMLRSGIMEYRLPKDILGAQINEIRDMGVEFRTDTAIGGDLSFASLKDIGYKAVFLAFGAQQSRKLDINGTRLDGVLWGPDFLRDINLRREVRVGERVTVIGGGDVAMDVALSALRLGARDVTVVCLEPADEMPAHEEGLKQVIDEGIHVHVSWGPKRILGRDGTVAGIELVRCISVFDKEGRFNPCFNEKKTKSLETDMVIFAIGQSPDLSHLPEGIKTTEAGTIAVDPVTLETSLPGVFAGGDVVSGPSSVVEAIAAGKRAAISIDRYLRGEDLKADREKERARVTNLPREGIEKKARIPTPLIPVSKRRWNFKEVKLGFAEEVALSEAQRCMTCDSKAYIAHDDCMTCFQCEILCPSAAIDVHPFKEVLPLAIEYQTGGEKRG